MKYPGQNNSFYPFQKNSYLNWPTSSRQCSTLIFWKGKQEVDFLLRDGNQISHIIQVAYDNLDNSDTYNKKISSLNEVATRFEHASCQLIAGKMPKVHNKNIIPLWNVLLNATQETP